MDIFKGFILFAVLLLIGLWFGGWTQPDLSADGGYEPCQTLGHPLYQDC